MTLELIIIINGIGAILAACIAYAKTSSVGTFITVFIVGLIIWPVALVGALMIKRPVPPPQPPGWYPDPWQFGQVRYYDGREWTYHQQAPV